MSMRKRSITAVVATLVLMSACATVGQLVSTPIVNLRDVQVQSLDLAHQTFLLSFDVTNPNPFPLPIRTIRYAVDLDGRRFASGDAQKAFTVPASGDGDFAISVELNLLQTAPELLFIAREGIRRDIAYSLSGEFGIDMPYAKPVAFTNDGFIRLKSSL